MPSTTSSARYRHDPYNLGGRCLVDARSPSSQATMDIDVEMDLPMTPIAAALPTPLHQHHFEPSSVASAGAYLPQHQLGCPCCVSPSSQASLGWAHQQRQWPTVYSDHHQYHYLSHQQQQQQAPMTYPQQNTAAHNCVGFTKFHQQQCRSPAPMPFGVSPFKQQFSHPAATAMGHSKPPAPSFLSVNSISAASPLGVEMSLSAATATESNPLAPPAAVVHGVSTGSFPWPQRSSSAASLGARSGAHSMHPTPTTVDAPLQLRGGNGGCNFPVPPLSLPPQSMNPAAIAMRAAAASAIAAQQLLVHQRLQQAQQQQHHHPVPFVVHPPAYVKEHCFAAPPTPGGALIASECSISTASVGMGCFVPSATTMTNVAAGVSRQSHLQKRKQQQHHHHGARHHHSALPQASAPLCAFRVTNVPLPIGQELPAEASGEGRTKQLSHGYTSPEYSRYRLAVPRHERQLGNQNHPLTPRADFASTRRAFRDLIYEWRLNLHRWDTLSSLADSRVEGLPTLAEAGLEPASRPESPRLRDLIRDAHVILGHSEGELRGLGLLDE